MSQDQSISSTPAGEEITEEVQHLQVEDEENTEEIPQPVENEENTPEMAMHLGLPPPEALDLSGMEETYQPIGRSLNRNIQITKLRPA